MQKYFKKNSEYLRKIGFTRQFNCHTNSGARGNFRFGLENSQGEIEIGTLRHTLIVRPIKLSNKIQV